MKTVTAWYRDVGDGLKFNHISDGFDPESDDQPVAKTKEQEKAWRGGIWIGKRAKLTNHVPPKLVVADSAGESR